MQQNFFVSLLPLVLLSELQLWLKKWQVVYRKCWNSCTSKGGEGSQEMAFMAVLSAEDAELPSFQFLSSHLAGRSGSQAFLHSLGVQAPKMPLQMETQPLEWAQPQRDTSGLQSLVLGTWGAELSYKARNKNLRVGSRAFGLNFRMSSSNPNHLQASAWLASRRSL